MHFAYKIIIYNHSSFLSWPFTFAGSICFPNFTINTADQIKTTKRINLREWEIGELLLSIVFIVQYKHLFTIALSYIVCIKTRFYNAQYPHTHAHTYIVDVFCIYQCLSPDSVYKYFFCIHSVMLLQSIALEFLIGWLMKITRWKKKREINFYDIAFFFFFKYKTIF